MKQSTVLRFVILALFLLAHQLSTIHSAHHSLHTDKSCHLCTAKKALDNNLHETSPAIFVDAVVFEVYTTEQRRVVNEALELTQKPLRRAIDLNGMQHFSVLSIPLGYYATAPPKKS